jgi:deoxyribodipyrimidine photolyase-related protein
MQQCAFLIFPHQLFGSIDVTEKKTFVVVEEYLFFSQYKFHKQKLIFHKASILSYVKMLKQRGAEVRHIESTEQWHDVRLLIPHLRELGFQRVEWFDTCDEWLEMRLSHAVAEVELSFEKFPSPAFLNDHDEILKYKPEAKKFFQTDYYIQQRKKFNILLNEDGAPIGGKWSYDAENRKKYPANKKPPAVTFPKSSENDLAAVHYVEKFYANNPGIANPGFVYPTTHSEAEVWFADFLKQRFMEFGEYEDAIVSKENFLNHSLLSPLINVGLLLPEQVIHLTLEYAAKHDVPMNSVEGFIRQVIGWREFIRLVYVRKGNFQRNKNYWQFSRKIPPSFYDGTTGILPVDQTIKKLLNTGYNHHIERLMILSNFMLLCEFDPDEVYRWFMEMYIDAYDWVMVPNVYGMGQFADGGLMCTKPYISGSNYIFKMSDFPKGGEWANVWDALFWRFMHVHRVFFQTNPRLGLLVKTFDKWPAEKRNDYLSKADEYLKKL